MTINQAINGLEECIQHHPVGLLRVDPKNVLFANVLIFMHGVKIPMIAIIGVQVD